MANEEDKKTAMSGCSTISVNRIGLQVVEVTVRCPNGSTSTAQGANENEAAQRACLSCS